MPSNGITLLYLNNKLQFFGGDVVIVVVSDDCGLWAIIGGLSRFYLSHNFTCSGIYLNQIFVCLAVIRLTFRSMFTPCVMYCHFVLTSTTRTLVWCCVVQYTQPMIASGNRESLCLWEVSMGGRSVVGLRDEGTLYVWVMA